LTLKTLHAIILKLDDNKINRIKLVLKESCIEENE